MPFEYYSSARVLVDARAHARTHAHKSPHAYTHAYMSENAHSCVHQCIRMHLHTHAYIHTRLHVRLLLNASIRPASCTRTTLACANAFPKPETPSANTSVLTGNSTGCCMCWHTGSLTHGNSQRESARFRQDRGRKQPAPPLLNAGQSSAQHTAVRGEAANEG